MKTLNILLLSFLVVSCTETKKLLITNHQSLPTPIGAYSHSVIYGDFIFVSGQIGIQPLTNTLKEGIEEQTLQIFENLKVILQDNGSDLNHITKTNIFLTDINQFERVNKIYSTYFSGQFPARSTIAVAALPKNASIEIECIAVRK
jgi:2-iminobutanoate/2-iminopropanoate deaminase